MSITRPGTHQIFLGELVRALVTLQPTDSAEREAIAQLLGFQIGRAATIETRASGVAGVPSPPRAEPERPSRRSPQTGFSQQISSEDEAAPDAPDIRLKPRRGRRSRARHVRIADSDRALAPQIETDPLARLQVFPQPLFKPETERSILALSLATAEEWGEIDLDRLIDGLTFHRPMPRELPRRTVETLRRGVHTVVDRRSSMLPFYQDQDALIATLGRLVGIDRVNITYFDQAAGLLALTRLNGARNKVPLASGIPVLLVSDLGVGRPPFALPPLAASVWLNFARLLEMAGCPLIIYFPYPLDRCPRPLARRLRIIHWDRRSSVHSIHRARHQRAMP